MRTFRYSLIIWLFILLYGLGPVVAGADPPRPESLPPPIEESAGGIPIQPASAHLDSSPSGSAQLGSLMAKNRLLSISPPLNEADPALITVAYDGQRGQIMTEEMPATTRPELNTAGATTVTSEDFEDNLFDPLFTTKDNNGATGGSYRWNVVSCFSTTGFPVTSPGNRSIWVAGDNFNGSPALNPCPPDNATYPAELDSWLIYGPFNLAGARDASLDFFFRLDNGGDNDDVLFWGASIDGVNFEGQMTAGVYNTGPFPRNHNFVSFDLTNIPNLGNLTGQPEVWVVFRFKSDNDAQAGSGAFIDSVTIRKNNGNRQERVLEPFEATFPTGYVAWLSHDNNGASLGGNVRWGSADCRANSGTKSMWVARYGADGLDPCSGGVTYPASTDSWLIYGPFNLQNVSEAWVDFYFRSQSEPITGGDPATGDLLYWWVSTDGTNYHGPGVSGAYTQGPHANGYNLMRFDLGNVPALGDLRGRSLVWFGLVFRADADTNLGEGPFLDDFRLVTVEQGPEKIYLPLLEKEDPEPPPTGGITFQNLTGNPLIIELVNFGVRIFPSTPGPHVWDNIPAGTYDWITSGTCPAGAGQVGSLVSGRQKVTIIAGKLDNAINVENGGKFDCSG